MLQEPQKRESRGKDQYCWHLTPQGKWATAASSTGFGKWANREVEVAIDHHRSLTTCPELGVNNGSDQTGRALATGNRCNKRQRASVLQNTTPRETKGHARWSSAKYGEMDVYVYNMLCLRYNNLQFVWHLWESKLVWYSYVPQVSRVSKAWQSWLR
ncbi:hypothetical protein ElyMa_006663200 [Elysia marginata]|uniref:Uncharacterized protein n=1 Tax=Elysia marginata TaxID=1093978 RepID=A0AAV4IMZ9_9GAST|nr:hypothetical protein ElyMa_006663200 [Elysia marginata]